VTTQLQFLLIAVAGWMSRHQQAVIVYFQEENRILLEQLGGKPKRFTDAQRIRLARKAKLVGRRRLGQWATLVTPDTLLPLVPCPGRQEVDLCQDQPHRCQRRNRMDTKLAVENGSSSGEFSSKDSLKCLLPSSPF
jgi:hypothetical protein